MQTNTPARFETQLCTGLHLSILRLEMPTLNPSSPGSEYTARPNTPQGRRESSETCGDESVRLGIPPLPIRFRCLHAQAELRC